MIEIPNEVSAFIETVQDWADNAESIANLDANIDYYMPIGFARAYIVNLQDAYSADTEFTISGSQYVAYYRLTAGGTVYASNIYLSNQDSATICRSPHFDITYTISSVSGHTVSASSTSNVYGVSADTTTTGAYCSLAARDDLGFFTSTYSASGNNVSFSCYTDLAEIPVLYSRRITSLNLVGGLPSELSFPSGLLSKATPWDYYNSTLIPYLQTEYPNIPVELLPPPYDEPYSPEYPTDFVTGIPKNWTITNPQLPDIPEIGIDKPSGDLPTISLAPYAHGVGFWWALVGEILDTTAFKTLCVTFLGVGLLIYCLWRLGR